MITAILLLALIILVIAVLLLLVVILRRLPPSPPPPPPYKIPDQFNEAALASTLSLRLAGTPADGSQMPVGAVAPMKVIWVDKGDEVLVHLDSTQVRLLDGTLLFSVDLETDQTGRSPLVVTFAMGGANDPAGLVATTDEYPRGNGPLAARWGKGLQAALWASVLGLAQDHATERGLAARGIALAPGQLTLQPTAPLSASAALTGGS
ncbi:MAG: hypothetical protein WBQ10_12400 [Terriglobales bacterium]